MFDFQKEVIINSNLLDDGSPRLGSLTNTFRVFRCADYKLDNLVGGVVYKTVPQGGKVGTATLGAVTDAGDYRISIVLGTKTQFLADFSHPWSRFSKTINAEFNVAGGSSAAEVAADMKAVIESAIPENYKFVKVAANGGEVVLTAAGAYQFFSSVELQSIVLSDTATNDYGDYDYVTVATGDITANVEPVGTGEWLQQNLRFPTYGNTSYLGVGSEERPIEGGMYTQYSFQQAVTRQGLHGQGTVGQVLQSVTTHTFYVLSSVVDAFEAAMTAGFGDVLQIVGETVTENEEQAPTVFSLGFNAANEVTVSDLAEGYDTKLVITPAVSGGTVIEYSTSEGTITADGILTATAEAGDKITVTAAYSGTSESIEFSVVE